MRSHSVESTRGAAKRERIIVSALAVISRVGSDALTHRLVADDAGVPLAATTYWFATKNDIVLAAFERAADRGVERIECLTEAAEGWTRETAARGLADLIVVGATAGRATSIVEWTLWVEAMRRPAAPTSGGTMDRDSSHLPARCSKERRRT